MSKKWSKYSYSSFDYNDDLSWALEEERKRLVKHEAAVRDEVLRQHREERLKKAEKELMRFNSNTTDLTYSASYTNGSDTTIRINPGALTAQIIAGQKDQPTGLKPLELLQHQVEEVRLEGRRALAA